MDYTAVLVRPIECTPEITAEFCRCLVLPVYPETAAAMCGFGYETIRSWLRQGEAEMRRLQKHPEAEPLAEDAPYLEFYAQVSEAMAVAEARLVKALTEKNPQRILALRFPERWGTPANRVRKPRAAKVVETFDELSLDDLGDATEDEQDRIIVSTSINASPRDRLG